MRTTLKSLLVSVLCTALFAPLPAQAELPWWWSEAWWNAGQLEVPANHPVKTEWSSVINPGVEDIEIPIMIARPDDNKKYPAVLFQHGRRGLDDLIQLHVKRLAAQGFVVVAADVFSGRFIEKYPIEHDYAVEGDVNKALDFLMARKDISSKQACVYSHTRGGYMSLKVAVKYQRQDNDLACYVSYYPHFQDPNAPEAMQVYRYALEADELKIPTLIFIGEDEQYQRRRPIEMATASLQKKKRPVRLIIYPGVGRGFDFRPDNVRTFADDLAAKDAIQRASRFMKQNLQ
ncbi:dienelactone hydrolase family protein [Sulfuriflexus mobilis]|uniref:dienelactone hydrolase family protein n=1 Tax=Sulfuriflexus mobilis TaxID=1811807 RepID=UPI000F81A57C|nr:dienelactone hydrolase family protein [Sulfuriflexus mobilis]